MKGIRKILLVTLAVALVLFSAACGQAAPQNSQTTTPATTQEATPVELTVAAAASLTDAMKEIQTEYAKEKPNVTLTFTFGSSGSLQQQIENGAPTDVFVSAAVKQMDALKEKGLIIDETRKEFLENKIVLVAPGDNTTITDFKDLTTDKVKKLGLGEPKSVPVGQYAEELLTKLNLLEAIKSQEKIVYGKDVKEVLAWVETGNADAGIVYATDAKISSKVKVAATAADGLISPVYYPAAVVKASKNAEAATDFTNFLYSDKAKPIFEKYGFAFLSK